MVRHRPIQGESNIDFLGESEGSLPTPQDSLPDAGEAINDFWSTSGNYSYLHHVEPRLKLYVPRGESFPIVRAESRIMTLDVMLECRIDDYWNPRPIRLADQIHTIHHIGRETSRWVASYESCTVSSKGEKCCISRIRCWLPSFIWAQTYRVSD